MYVHHFIYVRTYMYRYLYLYFVYLPGEFFSLQVSFCALIFCFMCSLREVWREESVLDNMQQTYLRIITYIYTSIQWWFTYTRFRSLLVLMRSLVLSKPFVCCNNRKRTEHDRWVKRVEMATEQKTLYTYSYTKIYTHILTIHHIHITNCRFLDVFM